MKQLEESAASSLASFSDSAVTLSCADGSVSKCSSVSVNRQRTSGFNEGPPAGLYGINVFRGF